MFTSKSNAQPAETGATDVLIPIIRAAATIGFVIAPCSLGFVIIAVSEQLIRSIMVGDDPEMLVSDLQNQFPDAAIEADEGYDAGLVAKVVDLIDDGRSFRSDRARSSFPMGTRDISVAWSRRDPAKCLHYGKARSGSHSDV